MMLIWMNTPAFLEESRLGLPKHRLATALPQ
jgi:hypothetical protein